jgi:citrate lyase subunit beta/citryl-CoA lyase
MPASNQRALEKAQGLAADVLVFDLEDSVGPEKKSSARALAVAAVQSSSYGSREIIVRANSLASEWGEADVRAIAQSGADGICLPKVETAKEIDAVIKLLQACGAPVTMQLWVMIETPLGVENIHQILAADQRVAVVVMGTTDLAKELRVPHTPERLGLQYSLGRCVHAARSCQREILDGVYLDLKDAAGFVASCQQGRELGFDGKTLIHPSQLVGANEVYGISGAELERAKKIIQAWQLAAAEGKGVAVVDGKLVEVMHVDESRRQLEIAAVIEQLAGE